MPGICESISIQLASSHVYQEYFENPPDALKVGSPHPLRTELSADGK